VKSVPLIVRAQDVMPRPWRNGGGQTRELLAWPSTPAGLGSASHYAFSARPGAPGEAPWRLRISLAEVSRNGPFSGYPGVGRWFTVVDGAGVRLQIDAVKHHLDAASGPLHFAGDAKVHCDLVAGPTRDLNLMAVGGASCMLPCHAGAGWNSELPQRGLFTRQAGRFTASGGISEDLPAHALLWLFAAAGQSFAFVPAAGGHGEPRGPGPAAWWLGYSPD